ncbi:hypothetical protein NC652_002354 [Populus alba x Populus x berolinensis]|nr:hypothetical protein NC652_002354 [Populus alba x Populus x berolinensis]
MTRVKVIIAKGIRLSIVAMLRWAELRSFQFFSRDLSKQETPYILKRLCVPVNIYIVKFAYSAVETFGATKLLGPHT